MSETWSGNSVPHRFFSANYSAPTAAPRFSSSLFTGFLLRFHDYPRHPHSSGTNPAAAFARLPELAKPALLPLTTGRPSPAPASVDGGREFTPRRNVPGQVRNSYLNDRLKPDLTSLETLKCVRHAAGFNRFSFGIPCCGGMGKLPFSCHELPHSSDLHRPGLKSAQIGT